MTRSGARLMPTPYTSRRDQPVRYTAVSRRAFTGTPRHRDGGAADVLAALDHRDRVAEVGGLARALVARRPGADDHEIEFVRHGCGRYSVARGRDQSLTRATSPPKTVPMSAAFRREQAPGEPAKLAFHRAQDLELQAVHPGVHDVEPGVHPRETQVDPLFEGEQVVTGGDVGPSHRWQQLHQGDSLVVAGEEGSSVRLGCNDRPGWSRRRADLPTYFRGHGTRGRGRRPVRHLAGDADRRRRAAGRRAIDPPAIEATRPRRRDTGDAFSVR